jgi:hypothetical protein
MDAARGAYGKHGQDNINMDLRETGRQGVRWDSSGSGQGQVVGCCEQGDELELIRTARAVLKHDL